MTTTLTVYVAAGYMIAVRHGKFNDSTYRIDTINTDEPDLPQFRLHAHYAHTEGKSYDFYYAKGVFDTISGHNEEIPVQYIIVEEGDETDNLEFIPEPHFAPYY